LRAPLTVGLSGEAVRTPAWCRLPDPSQGRSPRRVWTAVPRSATIVSMSTQSLRDVRDHLSEVIDRVEHQHERVVVTRNGKPAAVILSPEDLAQLQETIDVLSDPKALADIREADAAYARGDVVRGTDAVRQLRS
jgi:antitoxin YefM